jgi:FkbM family methyltransferase
MSPRLRGLLKAVSPEVVKGLYRESRLVWRSFTRVFRNVARCQVRGHEIQILVSSEIEQERAETYLSKEPETLDWLESNLSEKDVLFDVGANIGLYSLYAAKISPQCQIYAFEPAAHNYVRLCQNICINKARHIVPCNFPLADREAFAFLHVSSLEAGSALHSFGEPSIYGNGSAPVAIRQGALSTTLDTLVLKHQIPQPTLLKIDVDGTEEHILGGAQSILENKALRSVLVEVNLTDCKEAESLAGKMKRFGFTLAKRSEWLSDLYGVRSQNYVFDRQ